MNAHHSKNAALSSMHRNHETQTAYLDHLSDKQERRDESCDICRLIEQHSVDPPINVGLALKDVSVIKNEFPYENNDGRHVNLHHMIVPRQHVSKFSELSDDVRHELRETIESLLDAGAYDAAYSRSTYSPTASVPLHLHTHLFKFGPKVARQVYDPSNGLNEIEFEAN